jgi:hypothetical protein
MRKYLSFLIITFLMMNVYSISQDNVEYVASRLGPVSPNSASRILPSECPDWFYHGPAYNKVNNPTIAGVPLPQDIQDPFPTVAMSQWTKSHGSPQINIGGGPPSWFPANSNLASMTAFRPNNTSYGEGIIGLLRGLNQVTHGVEAGQQYMLTFYRKFYPEPTAPAQRCDKLNIYLLKCAKVPVVHPNNPYIIPSIPAGSQQIYCETNITSQTLDQIMVTFTAADDYDLIWIFPEHNSSGQAWINFGMPQLFKPINVWGTVHGVLPNGYYLGFGPFIFQSQHTWTDGNNNVVASYPFTAFEYDNPSNYGPGAPPVAGMYGPIYPTPPPQPLQSYTFSMNFPNVVTTNNTCSTPFTGTLSTTGSGTGNPWLIRQAAPSSTGSGNVKPPTSPAIIKFEEYKGSSLRVNVQSAVEEIFDVYVYDALGRQVMSPVKKVVRKGFSTHDLHLEGAKGIYIIKFVSAKNSYSQKVLL